MFGGPFGHRVYMLYGAVVHWHAGDGVMNGPIKLPWHFWLVGLFALLWNGFGCVDYFMTRTRGAAWIEAMMPGADSGKFMAYIDGFPIWASVGWAVGVWGALLGAILLLLRRRHAVHAFAASLVGALVGMGYQLVHPLDLPEVSEGAAAAMPYIVLLIAAALLYYAWRQGRAGRLS